MPSCVPTALSQEIAEESATLALQLEIVGRLEFQMSREQFFVFQTHFVEECEAMEYQGEDCCERHFEVRRS